ncbi:hypothetical protein DPMN_044785 [Dreissena polymorpha]|uniref:Uncharacterized protein n=1 Tax=Dreissena polymorpha TaxID=45954 RepID=A0A9D4HZ94_DREPO|nr:hypothetical protein DPMN_044785 [Dreissena polymorpha]
MDNFESFGGGSSWGEGVVANAKGLWLIRNDTLRTYIEPRWIVCFAALADEGMFIQTIKYYCKERGCRHHGLPEYKPTALCFYMLVG